MAQLEEHSLPIPEVHGSNLDTGNFCRIHVHCQLRLKDENKRKRVREWPIFLSNERQLFKLDYFMTKAVHRPII